MNISGTNLKTNSIEEAETKLISYSLEEQEPCKAIDTYTIKRSHQSSYFVRKCLFLQVNGLFNPTQMTFSGKFINNNYESGRKVVSKTYTVQALDFNEEKKDICNKNFVGAFFVNGIMTTNERCLDLAALVSKYLGGIEVCAIHNSSGGLLADLKESFYAISTPLRDLGGGCIVTTPVLELASRINNFFKKNPFNTLIIVGHSQGCLHVKHALEEICNLKRQRIFVLLVAPAPGAYIKNLTCRKIHCITNRWDLVGGSGLFFHHENVTRLNGTDHQFDNSTTKESIQKYLAFFKEEAINLTLKDRDLWELQKN